MSNPALTDKTGQTHPQAGIGATGLFSRPVFICLFLSLFTLIVFWQVRNFGFINFDDPDYFTDNPHVQQGLTLEGIAWAFTSHDAENWHPLTWLSHMTDATLFGNNPSGPHLINLILHIANTILLFLVLRALTSAHWRSALVATLFAVHPLHVESVAWVSERKDVLSTLFFLLAIWAYAQYASKGKVQNPKSNVFFAIALFLFALGLMSKPMLVTLPFVLLLLDFWPLGRFQSLNFWRLVLEKIPFFALTILSCVVTVWAQQKALNTLAALPLGTRIENTFVSYTRYLAKTFWPVELVVPYSQVSRWPWLTTALAVILLAGLCAFVFLLRRKQPFLLTGWFWFLGMLVPVIGLVQVGNQSMADRYTYMPLIGIFIIVSWGTGLAIVRHRLSMVTVGIVATTILLSCAARTMDQLRHWQDSETLFRHTTSLTKNNWVADYQLAKALVKAGKNSEAIEHYTLALESRPHFAEAENNLGVVLLQMKRIDEAIGHFRAVIQYKPNHTSAHANLGNAVASQGNWLESAAQYAEAVRLTPDSPEAHFGLAIALARLGRRNDAIAELKIVIQLSPDMPGAKQFLQTLQTQPQR